MLKMNTKFIDFIQTIYWKLFGQMLDNHDRLLRTIV